MERFKKSELVDSFTTLLEKASDEEYLLSNYDVFALGYLAGKYDLTTLKKTPKRDKAVKKYDEADELCLYDTIGETLIDLKL